MIHIPLLPEKGEYLIFSHKCTYSLRGEFDLRIHATKTCNAAQSVANNKSF